MKKSIFFVCLVLFGCSKGSNNPTNNQAPNTVSIGGTTYSTVVIGSQTWTTANYNGAGGENYNSGPNNPSYGKLYTEAEAQAIVAPSGWRLATKADFDNLFIAIGANQLGNGAFSFPLGCEFKLMTTTDWTTQNGTNDLKFNAEPAGCFAGGSFKGQGMEAMFLSSTIINAAPVVLIVSVDLITTSELLLPNATDRGSLRFVKDN
jgi:uncharacterized protein (TIGR02145 family)